MPAVTPEQRSERARIAALTRWSKQDPVEGTRAAREAFFDKLSGEDYVDRTLRERERPHSFEHMNRRSFHFAYFMGRCPVLQPVPTTVGLEEVNAGREKS